MKGDIIMSINFNFATRRYFVVEVEESTGRETRVSIKYPLQGDAMAALRRQRPENGYHYNVVSE